MRKDQKLKGLSLKAGPLGEYDRLLTILSDTEGIIRLAVPGARRPKSSLAAAAALTFLDLQITNSTGLRRVKQIKIIKSFSNLGKSIESLASAQTISELCLLLVGTKDPQPKTLNTVLLHLERLEIHSHNPSLTLGVCVQCCVHLLALGGYNLPLNNCSKSGVNLDPPIGNWDWICSFIPSEGFALGCLTNSPISLNASELALLQRLIKPELPIKKDGMIMGPINVWIKFLDIIDQWIEEHLQKKLSSLQILKPVYTKSTNPFS